MDARKQTKSPLNAGVALLILAALGVAIYLAITFSSRQTDDSARSASTGETTKNEPNSSSGGRETPPNFPASDSSPAGDSRLSPRPGATMAEEEADTSGTLSTTGITVGADGKPVPGVALEGWLVAPGLGNPGVVELPRTATSGPDGRFAFRKLPVKPERILKITAQAGSDWVIPEPVSVRPG
ncbi:hypothetical protein HYR69_06895, partial [Candidatus Sumerlaeota bacterium]|nr:hypothetical protein [Candidatus Sumerlaeota bacterium]